MQKGPINWDFSSLRHSTMSSGLFWLLFWIVDVFYWLCYSVDRINGTLVWNFCRNWKQNVSFKVDLNCRRYELRIHRLPLTNFDIFMFEFEWLKFDHRSWCFGNHGYHSEERVCCTFSFVFFHFWISLGNISLCRPKMPKSDFQIPQQLSEIPGNNIKIDGALSIWSVKRTGDFWLAS